MKIRRKLLRGHIYVNGWASRENPHAAGVYLGRKGRNVLMFFPDGKMGELDPRALVPAKELWNQHQFRSACQRALNERFDVANKYALEILWPLEYDDEVRAAHWNGKYNPPTFEEWEAGLEAEATP